MKNIFYRCPSTRNPEKTILMSECGRSPVPLAYGYKFTSGFRVVPGSSDDQTLYAYAIKIDPNEARVIQRVFHDFANGRTISRIVNELNSENIPTRRSRRWNYNAVSDILKNENYLGIFRFRQHHTTRLPGSRALKYIPTQSKETVLEEIPALRMVHDSLWDKVQNLRIDRSIHLQRQYRLRSSVVAVPKLPIETHPQPPSAPVVANRRPILFALLKAFIPFSSFGLHEKILTTLGFKN